MPTKEQELKKRIAELEKENKELRSQLPTPLERGGVYCDESGDHFLVVEEKPDCEDEVKGLRLSCDDLRYWPADSLRHGKLLFKIEERWMNLFNE